MEALTLSLMRPYRSSYSTIDLGRRRTAYHSRQDLTIASPRDLLLSMSYYQHNQSSDICVIYCHCNSGCRVEGVTYIQSFGKAGWNACLFDFGGSGQSEGAYVTLGHHQAKDLECIVTKIRSLGNKKILLWGRSMGAATIILYLAQTKSREDIIGCILDSPYSSLWNLIKRVGSDKSGLPGFIVEQIMEYLRNKINKEHLFDIKSLEPIRFINRIDLPLLFITSLLDDFVPSDEVVKLYQCANSKCKRLQYIQMGHNCNRDQKIIDIGVNFLNKAVLQSKQKKKVIRLFTGGIGLGGSISGANMADLIIKAEKEKDHIRRMKSCANFHQNKKKYPSKNKELKFNKQQMQSFKENDRSRTNYPSFKHPSKTQTDNQTLSPPLFKRLTIAPSKSILLLKKPENRTIKIHAFKQ